MAVSTDDLHQTWLAAAVTCDLLVAASSRQPGADTSAACACVCLQVSNAEEYQQTRAAMDAIGLVPELQDQVFQVVAAVLHLGNLTFREVAGEHEGSQVAPSKCFAQPAPGPALLR
jgi:hypothetical protein